MTARRKISLSPPAKAILPYRCKDIYLSPEKAVCLRDGSRSDEAWTFIEQENIPRLHNPAQGAIRQSTLDAALLPLVHARVIGNSTAAAASSTPRNMKNGSSIP